MGSIKVKVVPASSRSQIVGWLGDALKIKVAARPEKGKANEEVVKLVAKTLGISPDAIDIESGHASPLKSIAIAGMELDAIHAALQPRLTKGQESR